MLLNTMTCGNCHSTVENNFCGNCGQPIQIKRIDKDYILHEIWHILHFDKGILYTIKELLIRPGQNIKEFIAANRSRLVKPVLFIIVTSLIYTLTSNFFHIEKGYVNFEGAKQSAVASIFSWIQHHYGYANIIMGMFIAFWTKLFFRKYDYNFFEILILLCFSMGIGMLLFSVFAIMEGLTKLSLMNISSGLAILYSTWAIGQFFDQTKAVSYLKALASYILGMIAFSCSMVFLGLLIDFLKF